ncbi:MAG: nucleoside-diphosphate sugar epimerase [Oleiphilus sp.]|nr:MAG: nucleoside-diphosphate sugar epimerase [Oleiphilus sp.]
MLLNSLLRLPRYQKRLVSLLSDATFIPLALWLAFSLRLDEMYIPADNLVLAVLTITILASLFTFAKLGLYRAVIRYMSNHAMVAVFAGVSISTLVLVISSFLLQAPVPRSVPVIYWCLAMVFVGGSRMLARSMVHKRVVRQKERVVIYGAGKSGLQLSSILFHGKELQPAAFIDDNPALQGTVLNGVRVYAPEEFPRVIARYSAKRVLLALGHAPRSQRALVIRFLETYPVQVQTMPDINDVVSGRAKIEEIRDVDIEDLLGRDEVAPDKSLLAECINKKVVMVTGAGGSIGSELCRQIVRLKPSKLILFDLSEFALYEIEQELRRTIHRKELSIELHALMGSIQKQHRMEVIMSSYAVDTVYHAAAYKHVPLVEHNVIEGVRNNVFGTWYCAEAAIKANVETFVLISTDKAVRPTNVMGASKRMAELVLQGLAQRQSRTRFCMVRFGNVLGSSGSVVPLFRKQILEGGPVTVTHPEITRYFMTIPEAALLVLQAGSMGEGGEVFLLDMGEAVKIADLAEKLVRLMGLEVKTPDNPEGEIEIQYTGLRPGEKLYEELLIGNEPKQTVHPRIMKGREIALVWDEVKVFLDEIDRLSGEFDCEGVRDTLLRAPLGYKPMNGLDDLVWNKNNRDETPTKDKSLMPANEPAEDAAALVDATDVTRLA